MMYEAQERLAEVFGLSPLEAAKRVATLTARETQLAALLSYGYTSAEIAQGLRISCRTFRLHVTHIRRKLQTTRAGIGRIYYAAKLAAVSTHGAVTGAGVSARNDATTHHLNGQIENASDNRRDFSVNYCACAEDSSRIEGAAHVAHPVAAPVLSQHVQSQGEAVGGPGQDSQRGAGQHDGWPAGAFSDHLG